VRKSHNKRNNNTKEKDLFFQEVEVSGILAGACHLFPHRRLDGCAGLEGLNFFCREDGTSVDDRPLPVSDKSFRRYGRKKIREARLADPFHTPVTDCCTKRCVPGADPEVGWCFLFIWTEYKLRIIFTFMFFVLFFYLNLLQQNSLIINP